VNIQLKQRLVGAVVLVSLAVILIPMLLPGEGRLGQTPQGSSIPAEPDYRFTPLPEAPPAPPLAEAPPVPQETLPQPAKKPPKAAAAKIDTRPDLPLDAATPKQKPVAASKDGPATGWVVQVGSFSRAPNAHALRDKLRKQGHAAFVEAVKDKSGKPVFRVRVGPEVRRDLAEELQQRLARDAGLKGIVLRYP